MYGTKIKIFCHTWLSCGPSEDRRYQLQFYKICLSPSKLISGLGGLGFSMLASDTQVRGFEPGRSRLILQGEKFLSMPSFGGEVKPSVPCRRFAACKRLLQIAWNSLFYGKINRTFLAHISPFPC
jgi:hypothetical protein